MASGTTTTVQGGMTTLGALGVLFVALKLLNLSVVATWPWWLVCLPFYLPVVLVLVIGALVGVGYLVTLAVFAIQDARKAKR